MDVEAALRVVAVHMGWDEREAERFLRIEGGTLSFTPAGIVQLVTTRADELRRWATLIASAEDHMARLDALERRTAAIEDVCPGVPHDGH